MESPPSPLERLLRQLDLERLDRDLFLGDAGEGERRLFGGLVAAQSVVAAYRTVDDGFLHSLHAYFLRPGKHDVPIRYVVYRIRDGRTFTTRDVVAYQSGEAIFNLSSSFARPEDGVSHQGPMPDAPDPDGLPEWQFFRRPPEGDTSVSWMSRWQNDPIELRTCDPPSEEVAEGPPRRRIWMRVRGDVPDDPVVHAALLTYASDRGLIATVRNAHRIAWGQGSAASLDHALWFHHPPSFDGWLLYTSESPIAHAARALILGEMYRPDGTRVASVAQEGLIRVRGEDSTT